MTKTVDLNGDKIAVIVYWTIPPDNIDPDSKMTACKHKVDYINIYDSEYRPVATKLTSVELLKICSEVMRLKNMVNQYETVDVLLWE